MRLAPQRFNAHLNQIGQDFRWRQSSVCPCFNPNSSAAKPNCPLCEGRGRLWADPVEGKAGMTNAQLQAEYPDFGPFDQGDMVVTIPSDSPLYAIAQFDRLVLLNSIDRVSLPFQRSVNDRLRFPIKSIDRVFWLNQAGTQVIDGGIPAVDAAGGLSWADPASAPPPMQTYVIDFQRYAEYFVYLALPQNRQHHAGAPLPRKVIARRFDLFGR